MSMTLLLHGGSGTIHESDRDNYHAGLVAARDVGFDVLEAGGSAQDAVLTTLVHMENDAEAFNAGTGGSPTSEGVVECDAAIMLADGTCGAVAGITCAKNPILIADKVRTQTPHVLFIGNGANVLVDTPINNAELLTDRTRAALERWRKKNAGPVGSATVGAVALDAHGDLVAGTSTGGVLGKWPGRVGDSPLIGSGTYTTQRAAISCTGKGEAFIRAVTAKDVAMRLEYGKPLNAVLEQALADVKTMDGEGGLICLTSDGKIGFGHNAPHMAYAWKRLDREDAGVRLEPGITVI